MTKYCSMPIKAFDNKRQVGKDNLSVVAGIVFDVKKSKPYLILTGFN